MLIRDNLASHPPYQRFRAPLVIPKDDANRVGVTSGAISRA
jgi:hypothetical protein